MSYIEREKLKWMGTPFVHDRQDLVEKEAIKQLRDKINQLKEDKKNLQVWNRPKLGKNSFTDPPS